MKLRLGLNNAFLARWHPLPRDWVGIVAGDLDLGMVQFSWDLLDPSTPTRIAAGVCAEVRDAARSQGVDVETTFTGFTALAYNLLLHPDPRMRNAARRWFERSIGLSRRLGARGTGGHLGSFCEADVEDRGRRALLEEDARRSLARLSRAAAHRGLRYLMAEPSPSPHFMPSAPEDAAEWVERTGRGAAVPVLLCPDTAHLVAYRGPRLFARDLYAALRLLAPVSPVVHIRQTDGQPGNSWPFTAECNRRGVVRGPRLVEALEKGGARDVSLVMEPVVRGRPGPKLLDELRESATYWKEFI